MIEKTKKASQGRSNPAKTTKQPADLKKPWQRDKSVRKVLYPIYYQLDKETRQHVGLMMKVPVFIQDPLVAMENPTLGVQGIYIRLEKNMGSGPTSSRVVVVDFNEETKILTAPVLWDKDAGWFRTPTQEMEWLPDAPGVQDDMSKVKDPKKYKEQCRQYIERTLKNPYFHQVNVWAVVQRVLEFCEEPSALGRPVPWGFDGNRLIIYPHAKYKQNSGYDPESKSLKFYYFGDQTSPVHTCLSHDIIVHETGHAILDGIRPLYYKDSSLQTSAFHEFFGDLMAILLALFNEDIRHFLAQTHAGKLDKANVVADVAEQFGVKVKNRPYLRTAFKKWTMRHKKIQNCLDPHEISQVMTGAMWDILVSIADKHLAKNLPAESNQIEERAEEETPSPKAASQKPGTIQKVTPAQALYRATDRFRRIALQPLDLCPPCDIQFIDYAKAVIRNDILTNPIDERGYRPAMLEVFHKRGLCPCSYQLGQSLPEKCLFNEVMQQNRLHFVRHDIGRVSRSRIAAYYFLSDNRELLHIPAHKDVRVLDLYDAIKHGAAAEKLPREVVLEYGWQEEVRLENDPANHLDFGSSDGTTCNLDCGGTLVFDERSNLLSWFRKPGTEHITSEEEQRILKKQKQKRTALEKSKLADLETGQQRKEALKEYTAAVIKRRLAGMG